MIGKTLSHYKITEQLGKGGMGEVYLADDTTLDRKVALKFLPEVFVSDPERMARFEREAKLLASLNHPNIAGIYGLEEADGNRFLVLEYVEGETLQARLRKGALPLDDALALCYQIAEGLEAAHERGVIHRDLKPANVMITAEEKVKILDFGLAKALADERQGVDPSDSPTITAAMTQPGVVLGTAAYMSPEQAKGKDVDKRADIWAFGCILYECLTGKRVFEGETVTETLAAILRGDPEWDALPTSTPHNIRFLLRRCLERDRGRRFRDAADVYIEIEEARDIGGPVQKALSRNQWLAWCVAVLFIFSFSVLTYTYFGKRESAPTPVMRFQIPLPDGVSMVPGGSFALSPDGRYFAFSGVGSEEGFVRLWLHALDSFEARPLPGTESRHIPPFFWSHDSHFIAFGTEGKLKKVDISGGQPQTICDLPADALGGSWNHDGVIIFGLLDGPLMRVSASGGSAVPLTQINSARQETAHTYPTFLPNGRHFLYINSLGLYVGSLDAKPEEQDFREIMAISTWPVYVPAQDSGVGYLLFLHEQTLMVQLFDNKRLELIGEATQVADQVGSYSLYGFFSASSNGVLVYKRGGASQLSRATWYDRQGNVMGTAAPAGNYYGFTLSPDGSRAAMSRWDTQSKSGLSDIWLLDFSRGGIPSRFTYGKSDNVYPVWSPDGNRIVFARGEGVYQIYQKLANGAEEEELVLKTRENEYPTSWSGDGRFLLYTAVDPTTNNRDICVLPMQAEYKESPFLHTEFDESDAHFSPDMRWVAYVSNETGNDEIYVCGFQASSAESFEITGRWLISNGGGRGPRWRTDGKELYYRAPDGKVMAVEVTTGKVFEAGTPTPLFQAPVDLLARSNVYTIITWDVTADGSRFLLPADVTENSAEPFSVVLNWTSLLKQ